MALSSQVPLALRALANQRSARGIDVSTQNWAVSIRNKQSFVSCVFELYMYGNTSEPGIILNPLPVRRTWRGSNGYGILTSRGCAWSAGSSWSAIGPRDWGLHTVPGGVETAEIIVLFPGYQGFRDMEAFANRGPGPICSGCGGNREVVTLANFRLTGGIEVFTPSRSISTRENSIFVPGMRSQRAMDGFLNCQRAMDGFFNWEWVLIRRVCGRTERGQTSKWLCPPQVQLALRAPANQRSVREIAVSTPNRLVSIRHNSRFVSRELELYVHGNTSEPGMMLNPPAVQRDWGGQTATGPIL